MAKKRGNNEGSIYKRPDGSWTAQVSLGHDTATGKAIRKTFYGKTRKDVADKMAEALQLAKNGFVMPAKTTLKDWLDKWLTGYKKGQLKASTYQSYETLINVHINPGLGHIPLAKLQANTLQAFFNEKLENGRADGTGGLSTRTTRYLHTICQALQQAVKEGLLQHNVADATSPPVVKNKQMQPLVEAELLDFLEATKEDRLFAGFVLVATTGLRRGELLGLCWDCVNLEQGGITVRRQLSRLKGGLVLEETTKSKSGRRSMPITDDALRTLKSHRKQQLQEKLAFGEAYQDSGLVFAREDGKPLDPGEFTKRFQRCLVEAGLPKVRLHDLRHTHASLLLARGVHPKIVQERLGHSSIVMTLNLYSHLAPGLQEAAAATLNGLLGKEKSHEKAHGGTE